MKKVLLLTLKNFSGVGGIEKVGRILMKTFSDLEQEGKVEFLSYSAYDDACDERYISRRNFMGFKGNKFAFTIGSFFRNLKTDVVILSHINLSLVGLLFLLFRPKTKVILFAHGIEVWKPVNFLQRLLLKRCDQIIAVSHFTKQQLIDIHHVDEKKIAVLNNCIDPFLLAPASFVKSKRLTDRYDLKSNDIVLFTLSRLTSTEKYKGYDKVVEAISILKKDYPHIKYLIAGKSDNREQKRMDDLIEKLDVKEQVRLVGYVNEEEISDHFLLADLFILPSKKEGFGIVFCEAMLYGLPVISGNKDGSVDALRNGELGTMIDPDNIHEIVQAITSIIQHEGRKTDEYKNTIAKKAITYFGYDTYKRSIDKLLMNERS